MAPGPWGGPADGRSLSPRPRDPGYGEGDGDRRFRRNCASPHSMLTLLFDGVAYGMLLFVLAVGLAVTLGLMNFINLAHGAFAMGGGYVLVLLMQRLGWPYLVCLPAAFVVMALAGAVLERSVYRPMYSKPHLDQVLFSIGLTFMAVAAVDYFMGWSQQNVHLPEWLRQRWEFGSGAWLLGVGAYRLFI